MPCCSGSCSPPAREWPAAKRRVKSAAKRRRRAGRYVCKPARDDAELERIVFEVEQYEQSYAGARTTWAYPPIHTEGRRAVAEVTLTVTTANEQVATRPVTLLLVDDRGWWVCDIRAE